MLNKPTVSIVISTKNEAINLPRLFTSIANQTYKRFETIVVDNSSSDATVSIARSFTKKVFTRGPERSAQRNYGVSKAVGKYVLILDADMELQKTVLEKCVRTMKDNEAKALVIPERTVGNSFMARLRAFEREMYVGDATIEVARFFDRKTFLAYGGYDTKLTGAEDYDLPYRISKDHPLGRIDAWILHHEEQLSLPKQLRKKYYYAAKSARYADKHPELVVTQGNMLFRKAYLHHWKSFVHHPVLGITFILVRIVEASAAVLGYISEVGFFSFLKTLQSTLRLK